MAKTNSVYAKLSDILKDAGSFQMIVDNVNAKYNNQDWKIFSNIMPQQLSRQWNNILQDAEVSVMASTVGENDPMPMRAVRGFEKTNGSIPVIGQGFKYGIRDVQEMRDVNMSADNMLPFLYNKLFNRMGATLQGFHSRLNYWVYQTLAEGKIDVTATNSPDGVPFSISYDIPSENFRVAKGTTNSAKWTDTSASSTADPIADIREWAKLLKDKRGVVNPVLVMNETTFTNFIHHPAVIKQLGNLNKFSAVDGIANLAEATLWSAIKTTFGLPDILTVDAKFMVEKDGTPTEVATPMADNKIALLDINGAFNVYNAHQTLLDQSGANITTTSTENGIIAVLQDRGDRNIETTFEMQAYVAPILNNPNNIIIADVDSKSANGIKA